MGALFIYRTTKPSIPPCYCYLIIGKMPNNAHSYNSAGSFKPKECFNER